MHLPALQGKEEEMTANELMALCRALKAHRLTLTEFAILRRLDEEGDWVQLRTLREALGVTDSAISWTAQGLQVPKGYVAKARGQDERTVWICLTEGGIALMEEIRAELEGGENG